MFQRLQQPPGQPGPARGGDDRLLHRHQRRRWGRRPDRHRCRRAPAAPQLQQRRAGATDAGRHRAGRRRGGQWRRAGECR